GGFGGAYGYYYHSSYPGNLTNVNGTLFFTADDGNGTELWKSDGTAAGTTLVKDIFPRDLYVRRFGYYPNSSNPGNLTDVDGGQLFPASAGAHATELWKSDGTDAGTVLVKGINACSSYAAHPSNLTDVNGRLFFTATDGTHATELWKSDGTEAG